MEGGGVQRLAPSMKKQKTKKQTKRRRGYILSASPSLPYSLKVSLNSAKLATLGLGLCFWLGSGLRQGLLVWQG